MISDKTSEKLAEMRSQTAREISAYTDFVTSKMNIIENNHKINMERFEKKINELDKNIKELQDNILHLTESIKSIQFVENELMKKLEEIVKETTPIIKAKNSFITLSEFIKWLAALVVGISVIWGAWKFLIMSSIK